jgi:predicted RNA-binding protein with TRAM domain
MSFSYYSDRNVPVEVGKEYDAKIKDISRRGDGIAKIEGFVIFVPDTKQGERVKFKVTKIGNRYATAKLLQD